MEKFNKVIERNHTLSVKWDGVKATFGADDLHPMWVADMDFEPPQEVLDALQERVNHGVFGYTVIGEDTANSIINWTKARHDWKLQPEWLMYSSGVVPSIGMAIQAFTEVGDKVMIQSPVYTPFFNMIESNMRELVNSPLHLNNNRYEIDFEDFEEKLKSGVKLFILCSPHNPAGRVWEREELVQIAELCKKYNVIIASDEIHADLVAPPYQHIPIASIDPSYGDFIVTFMAPSKTFNLAGLQASFIVAPSAEMRKKIGDIQKTQGFHTLNTFGIIAMNAAYQHGADWLEEVLQYIRSNIQLVQTYVSEHLPNLNIIEPEGTYLIWIDCRKLGLSDKELRQKLLQDGKLAVNFGNTYGPGGEGFIRLNVACPRSLVGKGLKRLNKALGK